MPFPKVWGAGGAEQHLWDGSTSSVLKRQSLLFHCMHKYTGPRPCWLFGCWLGEDSYNSQGPTCPHFQIQHRNQETSEHHQRQDWDQTGSIHSPRRWRDLGFPELTLLSVPSDCHILHLVGEGLRIGLSLTYSSDFF